MKPARCIDWSQIVRDLEKAGMTQRGIGVACDKAHLADKGAAWVNVLKNVEGTQPRFHEGALLLGLWADTVGLDVTVAPKTDLPRHGLAGAYPPAPLALAVAASKKTV